ncbi:MAG: aminotransferase class V-fold PLP-dependent enzyme [Reyranella sp.]|nr:aminotransferase class V-fold PLP-dependent enzyme [Reyranella sp.]
MHQPPRRSCGLLLGVTPFSAAEICHHLDGHGVTLRGGHHCAQPLIRAFGVEGAARASLAPYTVASDIDALLNGLDDLVHGKPKPKHHSV